jgi:hypothetical protein
METTPSKITPLAQWQAFEHNPNRKLNPNFTIFASVFLFGIVLYALFTESPIMAVTFLLIGIVGRLTLDQKPRLLACSITLEGVAVNRDLYLFENILSFWIIDKEHSKCISLKTTGQLTPFVSIPLGESDPAVIRDMLLRFAKEERHDPTLIDVIEKLVHIE